MSKGFEGIWGVCVRGLREGGGGCRGFEGRWKGCVGGLREGGRGV